MLGYLGNLYLANHSSMSYNNITTNLTLSRHVRHENFVTDIKEIGCEEVMLMKYDERCEFVKNTEECSEDIFVFDYSYIYYCQMAPSKALSTILAISFLFGLCVLLFYILGAASDAFFCPSLKVLSKLMHLSENLAGVTLLAFGNCAPDMFTSIASIEAEAREIFNDVMGSVTFVTFAVTAAIILSCPFQLSSTSFLRDMLFLILDIAFLDYAFKSGKVLTLGEAIVMFSLYIIYIAVVCADQYLVVRTANALVEIKSLTGLQNSESTRLKSLQSEAELDILSRSTHRPTVIYDLGYQNSAMGPEVGPNHNIASQFFGTLFVIDIDEWKESNLFFRGLMILRFPVMTLLTIFLPVVDYEIELNGWSKLLNTLQIAYLPPLVIYGFTRTYDIAPMNIQLGLWLIPGSVPLAILAFIFSRTDRAPAFHKYVSILGVIGSIFVIYGCASELIQILKIIGYITHRSNSYLGCTLLAWGNSVGDLVANTAMAKHGYQKMGFAACFGGPIFNTLLTLGMIYVYQTSKKPEHLIEVGEGTMGESSAVFLLIGLAIFALSGLILNYNMRRSLAIFPLAFYVLYLAFCTLSEFELMHPYGSDHRLDLAAEPKDF